MALPGLPAENTDPWFSTQHAFDLAVKTDLEGRLSAAALSATFGVPNRSGGVAVLTDSISMYRQNPAMPSKLSANWHGVLAVGKGDQFIRANVYGDPGITVETGRDDYLPALLAADPSPESAAVCLGTNNMGSDAAMATGYDALVDIVDALTADGIRPVLWFAPPRGDGATTSVQKWNARVAGLARARGLQVVDAYTPLVNPSTGGIASAGDYNAGDTVHPNHVGHQKIADFNAALPGWLAEFTGSRVLVGFAGDAGNLILWDHGMFLSPAGGVGGGWFIWGAVTPTVVTADGVNWQRLAKASGVAGQGGVQYDITAGFAPGDVLETSFRLRLNSRECLIAMSIEFQDSGGAFIGQGGYIGDFQALIPEGRIAVRGVPIPAGTTKVRVNFQIQDSTPTEAIAADLAQIAVRNLTALGVV